MDDERGVPQASRELRAPRANDDLLPLARGREAVALHGQRHRADDRLELALAPGNVHACDLDGRRRQRLVQVVHPAEQVAELEPAEDLLQRRAVRRRQNERGRVDLERKVAAHRRELLRRARLLGVLPQRLRARGRELVDVLEHVLERPVLRDQLAGGLVADPRDARDVVGGVPLEADEVGNLLRRHPVARENPLRRVHVHVRDPARRHHQADVVRAELERVAVGRDDAGPHSGRVGAIGERGDDVVGLPALELEVLVAEGLDDRTEVRELLPQEIRHRPALDLVLGRELLPVNRARVPGDRDAFRPVVGEELEEHVREAEQRVRREALGRGELLRQGEVRPVGEVVAVDEEELGLPRGSVVDLELGPGQGLGHADTLRRAPSPPAG